MRILLVGGGSGGHVTPLRAISQSIAKQSGKNHDITLITDRKFYPQTRQLFEGDKSIRIKKIFSGKFRRYHNHSLLWHFTHMPTLFKNIRDILLVGIGFFQSITYFILHKPDVVFCKGGFTCVPVGLAAHIFRVPLYIHDSDTVPGLTNRILARYATKILTGMPTKYYSYDKTKMSYVGIPVSRNYAPVSSNQQREAKQKIGIDKSRPTVLVTGGGTGAKDLNSIISSQAESILKAGWTIIHVTGKNKSASVKERRKKLSASLKELWLVEEFTEMLPLVRAADLVVSRAGATTMQEFANAKKAVVIIPSPFLTGGHQLKNAQMFADQNAAIVFDEFLLKKDTSSLREFIIHSLDDTLPLDEMAQRLYDGFAKPGAADTIAEQLLNVT